MAATSTGMRPGNEQPDPRTISSGFFFWAASAGLIAVLATFASASWVPLEPAQLLLWILAALIADLMVVRFDEGFTFSMSLPVTLAAAMVIGPAAAGVVAFTGCLDPIEIRGGSSLSRALFNRAQVACATVVAGVVFRSMGVTPADWPMVVLAALLALATDFVINGLWTILALWARRESFPRNGVLSLFGSVPARGAAVYLLLGLYAPLLALVTEEAGYAGLLVGLAPLVLARVCLESSEGLARTKERLVSKDKVIRSSLDSLAVERKEERRAIAGELHDEVLPALFKVHLMGQVIRQDLASGKLLQLEDDVPELLAATEAAQHAMREVVAGLRESPLGPHGLASALHAVAERLGALGGPRVHIQVDTAAIQPLAVLAVFYAAREAMLNAAKHAAASLIEVRGWMDKESLHLVVEDDGRGFDPLQPGPDGHFGLQMMREHVEAVGGTLDFDSRLGRGTRVAVSVPADEPRA
jgi:signal transduction histidine kinase